jgi:glycosyltransferase involved in cell wall biosynthesis
MRVLFVIPEYPPHTGGGLLKFYRLTAQALAESGAAVTVLVATPYSEFADYEHDGVSVRFLGLDRVHAQAAGLTHLASAPTFRNWIAAGNAAAQWIETRPDFDVIETTDFGLLFAPLVSMGERPPIVVQLHGSLGQIWEREPPVAHQALDRALSKLVEASLLPNAEALQAISPANALEWSDRLGRSVDFLEPTLPLPALQQIPHGAFQADEAGALVVGRIQPWKGADIVCRALESGRLPNDFSIDWVGRDTPTAPDGGSFTSYLSKQFPATWSQRVHLLGECLPAEVAARQAAARLILVPSLWDTFNFTLVEAMSLAKVVVGSTGAGSAYLIDDGQNGFVFDPTSPESLADALARATALDAAERARMSQAARETVASCLNPARPRPLAWVSDFLRRGGDKSSTDSFLENVSMRTLTRHLGARVRRKLL